MAEFARTPPFSWPARTRSQALNRTGGVGAELYLGALTRREQNFRASEKSDSSQGDTSLHLLPRQWKNFPMDHRLGNRVPVELPIRWAEGGALPRRGRLTNFSLSGAFIECQWEARTASFIMLDLPLAEVGHGLQTTRIAAHVVRVTSRGIGVEWGEFAVTEIAEWLRHLTEDKLRGFPAIESASRPIRAA